MSTTTLYDRDRAARVGGFEGDMDLGREVARIMHSAVAATLREGRPVAGLQIVMDTIVGVAEELYDEDPRSNTLWLSAMHNSVSDMYRGPSGAVRRS